MTSRSPKEVDPQAAYIVRYPDHESIQIMMKGVSPRHAYHIFILASRSLHERDRYENMEVNMIKSDAEQSKARLGTPLLGCSLATTV